MEKEILYGFFDGTATYLEELQIREWLEQSDKNRREFLQERKLFDMMLINAEDKFSKVDESSETSEKKHPTFMKDIMKIAAAVALSFAVSYAFLHQSQDEYAVTVQTVSVPAGQRVNLTLADGTNVWLNALTTLTYSNDFGRKDRTLQLDGEAYFEVAKDGNKPFIIKTGIGEIEAKGTSFNVQAYASDAGFETTLMTGSVDVRLTGKDTSAVTLVPGQKAMKEAGKLQVETVDDFARYRWREGLICFNKSTFVEIMHDFEKYYDVKVEVINRNVMKNKYTGKFRYTDGIEYALQVLKKSISFKYRRDDEKQIIYIE
jgi:ferric-dicitrate binding protein FerR (iron transport regulator)